MAAVGVALLYLSDRVHPWFAIFVLDIGRNLPALIAKQLQNGHDRGVAFPERQVVAVVLFPILDVQGHDAVVVFAQEGNSVAAGSRKVSDVEVDGEISGRAMQGPLKRVGCLELIRIPGVVVAVKSDGDFEFLGELIDRRRKAHIR